LTIRRLLPAVLCLLAAAPSRAWQEQPRPQTSDLRQLSLEELMQIDVTSVSRRSEPVSGAAAAIAVITGEDIRRSGANNLPDALRLLSSLHVAQANGNTWAISARGFNTTTANKLLVLIDGRTIYTPLFSGVFWDVQDVMLEDIDRIEVIRGPGATLWGANAVNGIINIITKDSRDTGGRIASVGGGDEETAFGAFRQGGRIGDATSYRAYGKYSYRDALQLQGGGSARDPLRRGQAGFRVDRDLGDGSFTLQGDAYHGLEGGRVIRFADTDLDGGNVLARWSRKTGEESGYDLQVYYDYTHREIPFWFEEHRSTADVDFQQRLGLGERHDLVWGAGYRVTSDRVGNSQGVAFLPDSRTQDLFSAFAQDEIALARHVRLTAGSKLEYNESTGFEVQPSVRAAWTPNEHRTLWAAISRAVRTPTRLDEDLFFFDVEGRPFLRGDRDFESEELLAYELGYRLQPLDRMLLEISTFYNVYDNLRSQEPEPRPGGGEVIVLRNGLNAETWGAELRASFQATPWWRLHAGYAYFDKQLDLDPDSRDRTGGFGEGNDPRNRVILRSLMDLPSGFELDGSLRHVARLPAPVVPAYTELDLRLGWNAMKNLDFSLIGQNLLHSAHPEFGAPSPARKEVERSLFGRVTWRF
jgi:iron complex outermembrane receptor protein